MDLQAMTDRELVDLQREIGSEQIKRAQVKRAIERLQARLVMA